MTWVTFIINFIMDFNAAIIIDIKRDAVLLKRCNHLVYNSVCFTLSYTFSKYLNHNYSQNWITRYSQEDTNLWICIWVNDRYILSNERDKLIDCTNVLLICYWSVAQRGNLTLPEGHNIAWMFWSNPVDSHPLKTDRLSHCDRWPQGSHINMSLTPHLCQGWATSISPASVFTNS